MDLSGARWRKSSRSAPNGGHCVEVAFAWRKSSRSGTNGGACVEAARAAPDAVAVRDSKDPRGPALGIARGPWAAFVADAKNGRYDR